MKYLTEALIDNNGQDEFIREIGNGEYLKGNFELEELKSPMFYLVKFPVWFHCKSITNIKTVSKETGISLANQYDKIEWLQKEYDNKADSNEWDYFFGLVIAMKSIDDTCRYFRLGNPKIQSPIGTNQRMAKKIYRELRKLVKEANFYLNEIFPKVKIIDPVQMAEEILAEKSRIQDKSKELKQDGTPNRTTKS